MYESFIKKFFLNFQGNIRGQRKTWEASQYILQSQYNPKIENLRKISQTTGEFYFIRRAVKT